MLKLAICLCVFVACVSAGSVSDCNGKWWWLTEQKVSVHNPSTGGTYVTVKFDEVFMANTNPMIRDKYVYGQRIVLLSRGWLDIFSSSDRVMVPENANFQVAKSERLIILEKFVGSIKGNLKMGYHVIEVGDIRYQYTVEPGGWCRSN